MDSARYKYMDSLFLDHFKELDRLPLLKEEDPSYLEVKNATILTCREINGTKYAGVLDENGTYVTSSGFDALVPIDRWVEGYEPEQVPPFISQRVMYLGRYWPHWGHFLMDEISRLWYVLEREPNIPIAYDAQEDVAGIYEEFLFLAGIKKEQLIRVDRPTRFASVVVPECSHVPGKYVCRAFGRIFSRVIDAALKSPTPLPASAHEHVYLTRTQLGARFPNEVGEKPIEAFFSQNGYSIIAPEKLTLIEQIKVLQHADTVACVSGTLPHTMMLAREGTRVTIVRKSNKPTYRQMSVNQIKNLVVTYVDAHISLFAVGPAGPFILDVNKNVRSFASDNDLRLDYSSPKQFFLRKAHLLRYLPFYVSRNIGKGRYVPLYLDHAWGTTKTAKRELFLFYLRRL